MDIRQRAIITGATGMIGIALINQCIKEGIEVYAVCREKSAKVDRFPEHPLMHVVECNLEQLNKLDKAQIPGGDMFFHLGWDSTIGDGRNNMPLQLKNVQYTLDAVEAAHRLGCSVFVGAGSQAEYGRVEGSLNAFVPAFPENGYGMAKLCAGQMSRVECTKFGIRHIWTRILSIYGPYDSEKTMVSTVLSKLLKSEKPSLTACEQQWDYLYCDDAAKALLLLAQKGHAGKVYCIGSGKVRKLREYVEIMKDKINPVAELGIGDIPYGEKQVMYLCADVEDLKNDTGFEPSIDFEVGIEQTIQWMKSRKAK